MKPDAITNQISAINLLHMVHFYHLSSADSPIYGILAYYQDKTINLANTDKHFAALFEKLAAVYASESLSSGIVADEETKRVLQNAASFSDEFYKKMLSGYNPVNTPMIAPGAFSHIYILPIVKHVLNILYDAEDEGLSFTPHHKHWFGKGILDAHKGGSELHFPYRLLSHSPLYTEVNLSNVLSTGNMLNIYISFEREGLTVSCNDSFHSYEGSLSYHISKDKADLSELFTRDKEVLTDSKTSYSASEDAVPGERVLKLTGTSKEDWASILLPWGGRVFLASQNDMEYRCFCSEDSTMKISHCRCFRYLTEDDTARLAFGFYDFRLYEHDDVTELHFLDLDSPGSGLYAAKYTGNCYTI